MHIPVFKRPLPFVLPNHCLRKKEYCFVDSEIQILLELQVAKEVQQRPICVSLQVVVPKAGGRHRMLLDLRWVNESISTPSLEQSELTELRRIVRPGDQFAKLDLENGFWDLSVVESSIKYLGFRWMGKYYQWCALPFGLACSPCYFAKLVQASLKYLALRIPRLPTLHFVDDLLLSDQSVFITMVAHQTVAILESLGWKINMSKSVLTQFK